MEKKSHNRMGHHPKDDVNNYYDNYDDLVEKVNSLVEILKEAKNTNKKCIVFTGAGVSTSANLPDYRGPEGIWTLADKGIKFNEKIDFSVIKPTICHMVLVELEKNGYISGLVSTNVDGLHLRSGFPREKLAELHGNAFIEYCESCKNEFLRDKEVVKVDLSELSSDHYTGNFCEICGGKLCNNIVIFGEFLRDSEMEKAGKMSWNEDIALVLGTSLRVAPANIFPTYSWRKNGGKLIIVNLQKTPFDQDAHIKLKATTDDVFFLVSKVLNIPVKMPNGDSLILPEEPYLRNYYNSLSTQNSK